MLHLLQQHCIQYDLHYIMSSGLDKPVGRNWTLYDRILLFTTYVSDSATLILQPRLKNLSAPMCMTLFIFQMTVFCKKKTLKRIESESRSALLIHIRIRTTA